MNKTVKPHEIEDYKNRRLMTTAEVIQTFERAPVGSKFVLSVRLNAALIDDPESVFPNGISTYLNISRADAIRIAREGLSKTLEERGGRFTIFTSKSTRHRDNREIWSYWISQ
ncbi:hypothetical protein CPT_Maja_086 [Burkholderia phage Maja]|uniref:Uncharacterized protein n=1 Tax=Burkholderia phage Maja TaxID=2767571 RepID=A0A7S6R799_9CAUD|nr:hypothetical protein CPT_Maja_086 [Burkholderia phage Maja]